MKYTHHLIVAFSYFLLVVFAEVALYYLALSMPLVGDYSMLLTVVVFLGIAWLLKLRIPAVIISLLLIALYGVLSFYADFPIYYIGYPDTLSEFLPMIAVKTAYFSFPIIAYVALVKRK